MKKGEACEREKGRGQTKRNRDWESLQGSRLQSEKIRFQTFSPEVVSRQSETEFLQKHTLSTPSAKNCRLVRGGPTRRVLFGAFPACACFPSSYLVPIPVPIPVPIQFLPVLKHSSTYRSQPYLKHSSTPYLNPFK